MAQSASQSRSIGVALARLRFSVVCCCWLVGVALAAQVVIWSLATYTDLRFETPEEPASESAETVVVGESQQQQRIREIREAEFGIDLDDATPAAIRPQRVPGRLDRVFEAAHGLAGGLGRCAMLAAIPLMMVALILCATAAVPGVDRMVSSLTWTLALATLVLPFGELFGLPWQSGALTDYQHMTAMADKVNLPMVDGKTQEPQISSLVFFSRLALLPIACVVGVTLVGLRFGSGIEAGVAREDMRLDPALEREAGNISPSSLHAGRSAGALGHTLRTAGNDDESSKPDSTSSQPHSARAVSTGDAPKRLI